MRPELRCFWYILTPLQTPLLFSSNVTCMLYWCRVFFSSLLTVLSLLLIKERNTILSMLELFRYLIFCLTMCHHRRWKSSSSRVGWMSNFYNSTVERTWVVCSLPWRRDCVPSTLRRKKKKEKVKVEFLLYSKKSLLWPPLKYVIVPK